MNGAVTITSVPAAPAPVEQPEALPAPVEPVMPEPVEDPAKPKHIRKVAGK
jgi:hypothetical protein